MNVLLDTHALIWFFDGAPMLSRTARAVVEDEGNRLYLSAASFIEMGIKISLGKLKLSASSADILANYVEIGSRVLDISPAHGTSLESLPFHHRDPFDRLLAVQALTEDLTLVSKDVVFDQYDFRRVW